MGENEITPPEALGDFPAWSEGDGPIPYVFDDKPPGSQCAWACRWGVGNEEMTSKNTGSVEPQDWIIMENMTNAQLYYELRDVANREGPFMYQAKALVVETKTLEEMNVPEVVKLLHKARAGYPSYLAPWNLPARERIMRPIYRPGWDPLLLGIDLDRDPTKKGREVMRTEV